MGDENIIIKCEIYTSVRQHIIAAWFDDGSHDYCLGAYYPDELSFTESEFVGLSRKDARELIEKRDQEYLRG